MPKKYRLTGEEIRALKGKRIAGKYFSLLVAPATATFPKCACVASKKVSLKAVERNTIKRRCRSVLQKSLSRVASPLSLVFYAKREALDASFSEIREDIDALIARARP